jgi:hypothetical protein
VLRATPGGTPRSFSRSTNRQPQAEPRQVPVWASQPELPGPRRYGSRTDPGKVAAIQQLATPKTLRQVRHGFMVPSLHS